jgi:hypothetical protein
MHQNTLRLINEELKVNNEDDQYQEQIERIKRGMYGSWLINPESGLRTGIDSVSLVLLLLISLYIPFTIAFDIETASEFKYTECFFDIWFIIELWLNFLTGYYDKGVLIMDLKLIALNYCKGYLALDIISSIPISFIALPDTQMVTNPSALQSAKFIRIVRMTRYLRLLRLIRLLKVSKVM